MGFGVSQRSLLAPSRWNSDVLRLEDDSVLPIKWFQCNYVKLNQDRCQFLMVGQSMKACANILAVTKFGKIMIQNVLESILIAIQNLTTVFLKSAKKLVET